MRINKECSLNGQPNININTVSGTNVCARKYKLYHITHNPCPLHPHKLHTRRRTPYPCTHPATYARTHRLRTQAPRYVPTQAHTHACSYLFAHRSTHSRIYSSFSFPRTCLSPSPSRIDRLLLFADTPSLHQLRVRQTTIGHLFRFGHSAYALVCERSLTGNCKRYGCLLITSICGHSPSLACTQRLFLSALATTCFELRELATHRVSLQVSKFYFCQEASQTPLDCCLL